jgi:glycosyltransferase involved in cell wall biosynthesis
MEENIKLKEVSVVIPMYNSEDTIKRALLSVINQTYHDYLEIIVVNDGSKDNSVKIVEDFIIENPDADIRLINQENGGVSKARNVGMRNAKGNFIALLDSDDEWVLDKIKCQMEVLKSMPSIDFLGCSRNNEELQILGRKITSLHKANIKELLIKMYPQTSTAIFKTDVYKKIGGYDEKMTHGEDGEFWIRICANSNFYYMPDSLVKTGDGKPSFGHSGLSANLKAMQKGNEIIINKALKQGLISYGFYTLLLLFYKVKYYRRILITKTR